MDMLGNKVNEVLTASVETNKWKDCNKLFDGTDTTIITCYYPMLVMRCFSRVQIGYRNLTLENRGKAFIKVGSKYPLKGLYTS